MPPLLKARWPAQGGFITARLQPVLQGNMQVFPGGSDQDCQAGTCSTLVEVS